MFDKETEEQVRIRLWVKEILENFPKMERPAALKSLDDCKRWFKEYKSEIRAKGVEWEFCKDTLKALGMWRPRLTKNQAYMMENVTVVNLLYKHYVL